MKFECEKCGELVDLKDVVIVFIHAMLVGTSIYAYCPKCYSERGRK